MISKSMIEFRKKYIHYKYSFNRLRKESLSNFALRNSIFNLNKLQVHFDE